MSPAALWHTLPHTVRTRMSHLGRCLGAGSVKQVNLGRFGDRPDESVAVAVLRRRVQDEALASLSALEVSEDLSAVASRLGQLVYGELRLRLLATSCHTMLDQAATPCPCAQAATLCVPRLQPYVCPGEFNLFAEGEALSFFANTSIGQHPRFRVMRVKHHSPNCLVEEVARGQTVARALRGVSAAAAAAAPVGSTLRLTLDTLVEFHRAVLTAFVTSGLIHSDIHLGNLVQELGSDGAVSFALFDVGQFERVSAGEVRALLWALSWISTPERQHSLRHVAMAHLVQHSSLDVLGGLDAAAERGEAEAATPPAELATPPAEAAPPAAPQTIEARILRAFDGAIAPDKDGVRPDKKTAWILFLRNASRGIASVFNRIVVPALALSPSRPRSPSRPLALSPSRPPSLAPALTLSP